jgi:hypothetical protein
MPDIQINRVHSGAICNEIGERLSSALGPQDELPARLLTLVDELVEVEPREVSAATFRRTR